LDLSKKYIVNKSLSPKIEETQKVVHAPSFKLLSQATKISGEVKSDQLFAELEKIYQKIDEKDEVINFLKSNTDKTDESERKIKNDLKQLNNRNGSKNISLTKSRAKVLLKKSVTVREYLRTFTGVFRRIFSKICNKSQQKSQNVTGSE